jgi:hypothetical protein
MPDDRTTEEKSGKTDYNNLLECGWILVLPEPLDVLILKYEVYQKVPGLLLL